MATKRSGIASITMLRLLPAVVVSVAMALNLISQVDNPRPANRERFSPGLQLEESHETPGPGSARLEAGPDSPASATIRFLQSIPEPEGASERKSLFQRLKEVFFEKSDETKLIRPLGLLVVKEILYVTDPGSHGVFLFDLKTNSIEKITSVGKQELVSPIGIAVTEDRIFLSDSYLRQVFVYDRNFRFLHPFTDHLLERPTALAWNEKLAKLYVADTAAHHILVYKPDGTLEKTIGERGTGPGEFNFPTHLWLDPNGTLVVVDSLNYRVQRFRGDGVFLGEFGQQGDGSGDFSSPKGIASDSRGNVYVVDALFDAVQIFDPDGGLLFGFGERGMGPGQFWLPNGLFIDARDRIFVADSYNRRIQVFEFLRRGR